ncbi:MAG: PSD1 and planctomycete cytochrome C domain-containing protein [Pirellulales bacterium]|nr:PSD1 and planctomycete cytochrome C domain-containing protein [Pirellulales bacterium]
MFRARPLHLLLLCFALAVFSRLGVAAEPVNFSRDIRPILSNTCYKCHGPDEKERQANLRLDTSEGLLARSSGELPIVAPGDSQASELYRRIATDNPDEKMPPPSSGKRLSPEQIDLIRRWIDEGAEWKPHWAFVPVVRPEPPAVRHEELVRNPIDRFVFARLEAEGLEPAPPADRVTLIRRLTLDLTGLPPTPEEVDAFLADSTADALDRLISRLLASPRYGEHMARYWLDAARYGDTHGLHLDNERSLWPYRDWVIAAFNQNMPFDRFTVEQLAGDLLPDATRQQRVASGFNRCNVSTSEGGSIDEEVRVRYAVDRVETTATVFLGLTLGCAVCHDHKYDPFTQRDFYQLMAYFNSVAEAAMDGNALLPPPILAVPTPEQEQQQGELTARLTQVRELIANELAQVQYTDPTPDAAPALEPQEVVWIDDDLPPGAQPTADGGEWQWAAAPAPVYAGARASTRTAAGLSQHFFTGANPGLRVGEQDTLFCYVYLDPQDPPREVMLQFNDGSWEHRAAWGEDLIPWGAPGSASRKLMGPLPAPGRWVRLEVPAAEVGLAAGAVMNGWAFTQHGGTVYWDRAGIVTRVPQGGQPFESQAVWEVVEHALGGASLPEPVRKAVQTAPADRTPEQAQTLRQHFLLHVYPPTRSHFEPLLGQQAELEKQLKDLEAAIPKTMVMQDLPQPRQTYILIRGAYDKPGEPVQPGTPAALPPLPADAPPNRLGLARWLVDPSHPLTARVTVNRLWQQLFGAGLVRTPEDFGSQGQWPTHPELLDWLASEFIASGWNVQHMLRLMVGSYTYQQASRLTPELWERDPANALLARGPRFRLDAEVVRDAALYSSGLLVEQIGGRSVKPYQPPGVWEAVGFVGSNTSVFTRDSGPALYRRSVYTFWKRTAPPPGLAAFDAPSRETCTVRRARTNTPLQSLVLMNDEQYVEAARHLAQRMLSAGPEARERLRYGFRWVAARQPDEAELDVLLRVLAAQQAEFQADPAAAEKLLSVGESPRPPEMDAVELAAYTMVGNLLLNLDEAITKE